MTEIPAAVEAELARLRAENARLLRLPLFRPARRLGATVFLNLEDLEPHMTSGGTCRHSDG